jgi:hypothetical protein
MFSGGDIATAIATAAPLLAAVAGIAGYTGSERFAERARRRSGSIAISRDARASRLVSGLKPVAAASTTDEWAEAAAQALPAVTGFPLAHVYLRRAGDRSLEPVASTDSGGGGTDDDPTLQDAERAMEQGIASTISFERLPEALKSEGYRSGIAAPLVSVGRPAGTVFLYSKKQDPARQSDVEQVETYLSLSTRFLLALEGRSAVRPSEDRLSDELIDAGREGFPLPRPAVKLGDLQLDPASERSLVGGVAISLSRSEFDLLYTLASAPGDVISPTALTSASGGSGTVDVTIHRLRRKLGRCPEGQGLIQTVRGKGYMLVTPGS